MLACCTSSRGWMARHSCDGCVSVLRETLWTGGQPASLQSATRSCSMNEHFAVEPTACASAAELRHLLEKFGPYAGRYIASFPASWVKAVRDAAGEWTDIERMRASVLLQRAEERYAVVWRRDLKFDNSKNWLQNL